MKGLEQKIDLEKQQEDSLDAISLLELKQKENQLRLRCVPEHEDEQIHEEFAEEFLDWLELEKEEIESWIDKIFRIKCEAQKGTRKFPGEWSS